MEVAILSKKEAYQAGKDFLIAKPDRDIYVISIVDPQNENPTFHASTCTLNLKFSDTSDPYKASAPNMQHAQKIVQFVNDIPTENSFLVVHCEQGISRSATVGLFAHAFHYGVNSTREKFKNYFSRIQPNELLAQLLNDYCFDQHFGILESDEFFNFVKEINTMDVYGLKKWT
jgi:predicted protein tyrosine phosphatase